MRTFIGIALLLPLIGCGKSDTVKYYRGELIDFQKFINPSDSNNPNLNLDRSFVNNDYPIQIALYQDNQFYYDLPNLGDGKGTWAYKDGHLRLTAKRTIFDMVIEVHPRDQEVKSLAIEFRDRFGLKVLTVENENID